MKKITSLKFHQIFNSITVPHLHASSFKNNSENKMKKKRKSKFHQFFVRIIVPSHTCKMVLLKKKSEDKIEVSPSHPCLPDAFLKTKVFDIVGQQNNQVEKCEQDISLNISSNTPRKIILYMVYLELGGKEARPAIV